MSENNQRPTVEDGDDDVGVCPRCEAAVVGRCGALSRLTRDGGAEVFICARCGQRESLYGRDLAAQVPLSDWPVEIELLVAEERALIERSRAGGFLMVPAAKLHLGEGEDEQRLDYVREEPHTP